MQTASLPRSLPGLLTVLGVPLDAEFTVVTARGDVDLSTASLLHDALTAHQQARELVLDASRVRFCAVAGARVIHQVAEARRVSGARLVLVESVAVHRVLQATGLAAAVPRVRRLVDVPRDVLAAGE